MLGWLQAGYENEEEDDGGVVWIQTDHGGRVHGHVPPGLWVNASESGEDLVRLSSFFLLSNDLVDFAIYGCFIRYYFLFDFRIALFSIFRYKLQSV